MEKYYARLSKSTPSPSVLPLHATPTLDPVDADDVPMETVVPEAPKVVTINVDVDAPEETMSMNVAEEEVHIDDYTLKDPTSVNAKRCNPFGIEGPSSSRIKRSIYNGEEPFDIDALEWDPTLRIPISEYPPNERDTIRRAYLAKGPCQPKPNGGFPLTRRGNNKQRRGFSETWYTNFHEWIDYSTSKDAAFCLYCYLFGKDTGSADNFVIQGFSNWKKRERLLEHVGKVGSAHRKAYMAGKSLLNQNQSIVAALIKQTDQAREDYKDRLEASIKVVCLLLELGLPFRGHDESEDSMSKGKFHTCLRFLVENNEKARDVQKNTPGNSKMTSPKIHKKILSKLVH